MTNSEGHFPLMNTGILGAKEQGREKKEKTWEILIAPHTGSVSFFLSPPPHTVYLSLSLSLSIYVSRSLPPSLSLFCLSPPSVSVFFFQCLFLSIRALYNCRVDVVLVAGHCTTVVVVLVVAVGVAEKQMLKECWCIPAKIRLSWDQDLLWLEKQTGSVLFLELFVPHTALRFWHAATLYL